MGQHFEAPWSAKLKLATAAVLGILAVVVALDDSGIGTVVVLAVVGLCAAFSVRGYSVVGDELLVHRLGWATRFRLEALDRAEVSPGATLGSIRLFGIGGLFASVGLFRNAVLGSYHAYATDDAHTVVLDFGPKRVVVTPDRPVEFVAALHPHAA